MSFSAIRGQEKAINLLKAYMFGFRLKGSYLFVGPAGVGKKLTALALAKALNCVEENSDSCDN